MSRHLKYRKPHTLLGLIAKQNTNVLLFLSRAGRRCNRPLGPRDGTVLPCIRLLHSHLPLPQLQL